eukprot:scaffold27_cov355-Prasinococcus_capsulatus_cf.AAC.5
MAHLRYSVDSLRPNSCYALVPPTRQSPLQPHTRKSSARLCAASASGPARTLRSGAAAVIAISISHVLRGGRSRPEAAALARILANTVAVVVVDVLDRRVVQSTHSAPALCAQLLGLGRGPVRHIGGLTRHRSKVDARISRGVAELASALPKGCRGLVESTTCLQRECAQSRVERAQRIVKVPRLACLRRRRGSEAHILAALRRWQLVRSVRIRRHLIPHKAEQDDGQAKHTSRIHTRGALASYLVSKKVLFVGGGRHELLAGVAAPRAGRLTGQVARAARAVHAATAAASSVTPGIPVAA